MKSVTGRSLIAVYFLKLFKSSCKPDMASRDWTAWLLDWPEPGPQSKSLDRDASADVTIWILPLLSSETFSRGAAGACVCRVK
jgi:hypothetical protein